MKAILILLSLNLYARDLVGSINELTTITTNLGYAVAGLGIIYSSFFLMAGKHEGKEKVNLALMGSLLIALAQSIVNFIRGIA